MTINNNRRRLIAAASFGAAILPFSRLVKASTELPECESGEIINNQWKALWDTGSVSVYDLKPAKNITHIDEDFRVRSEHVDDLNRSTSIFRLVLREDSGIVAHIGPVPYQFRIGNATYELSNNEPGKLYQKFSDSGSTNEKPDVRFVLERSGKSKRLKFADYSDKPSYRFSASEAESFFREGSAPLYITLKIDNVPVASRRYDVNGALKTFEQAKEKHLYQKYRKESEACTDDISCFLTTATCGRLGLSDNCWELNALREFRDNYMLASETGKEQVAAYYNIAPNIVSALAAHKDSDKLYLKMYWRYILPSALLIKLGLNQSAHQQYISLVKWVAKQSTFVAYQLKK